MGEKTTVIVCGLGILGSETLHRLAHIPGLRIIGGDLDEDLGERTVNFAREVYRTAGEYPDLEFVKMDLKDVEGLTRIFKEYAPDLVFQCGTMMSWWVLEMLPEELRVPLTLEAGMSWLIPMHLIFPRNVVLALKQAGLFGKIHYVNASFPDATGPILSKIGLAPDTGIGNICNYISRIRGVAAKRLNEPIQDVQVYMVCHHFVTASIARTKSTAGAPYYLKVTLRGEDVTEKVDPSQELKTKGWPEFPKVIYGREYTPLVAECAMTVLKGLLLDTNTITHAPGPNGFPGGYPIRVSSKGVEVVLPKDITLDKAIRINNEGGKFEGIEKIKDDGTVVYTDKSYRILKEKIGYDCKELKLDELEKRAKEIGDKVMEIGKKLGWAKPPVYV